MEIIRTYNFNKTLVTDVAFENTGTKYVWIAFLKDSDDKVYLRKVSSQNLNQIYVEVEITADKIVEMQIVGNYIFLALESSLNMLAFLSIANPIVTYSYIAKSGGITENPVSIFVDSAIYLLFPGNGIDSKVVIMNLSGTVTDTITLTGINDAVSINYHNGDIWVVTSGSPSKLVRIYNPGGGYTFTSTDIVYTI